MMKIDLARNNISLVNTITEDIDIIIEFEKSNAKFVCSYSKEKHMELLSNDDCLHLSIRQIDNQQLVGHLILFGLKGDHSSLEFRRITVNKKGMGFGREAIKLLKYLCFEELKFHRLWLDVYDHNKRAIHLYESEGFILEGVLRDAVKFSLGYHSLRIYSMLDKENFPK